MLHTYKTTSINPFRLPSGWIDVFCGDAFTLSSGKAKTQATLQKEGGGEIPVYGGNGVTGYTTAPLVENPTIVIGRVGEYCGSVHTTPGAAWITDNALYAKSIKGDFSLRYLYYYLTWYDLTRIQDRTGQPLVTQTGISKVPILSPPLPEQHRIAEILDTADTAILQTERLIAKLKAMKAGLLNDLLTRGLDQDGRLRDPVAHPEQFRASPLGRVPKVWKVLPLGQLVECHSGTTPSRSVLTYWRNGTIPWVKTGEVNFCVINRTEEAVTERALSSTSLRVLPVDTVLVAMYGQGNTRGKCAMLGIPATTNQACAALMPSGGKIQAAFLYHYLSHEYLRLRNAGHGSHQTNLSTQLLQGLYVICPPIEEQTKLLSPLLALDDRIHSEQTYLEKLTLQKRGLMHDLLTGRVRVKV